MVKNHDSYIRLHTGPQGGFWRFLLRAVKTPIFALSVREHSATEFPDHASAKRKVALRSSWISDTESG